MNQLSLFDRPKPTAITPSDPHVEHIERPRLTGQNAAILARLKDGPATNSELAGIALKYTSRISDLRKAGYVVEIVDRDKQSGIVMYELSQE